MERIDPDAFIKRASGFVLSPVESWKAIRSEKDKKGIDVFKYYAFPLILLGSISIIIGGTFKSGAITEAFIRIVINLIFVYIMSRCIPVFAGYLNFSIKQNQAYKLICYSMTSVWLIAIPANLSLFFIWMAIFGLHSLYLLWTGVDSMLQGISESKSAFFFLIVLTALILQFSFYLLYLNLFTTSYPFIF